MRILPFTVFTLLFFNLAFAHPGIGMVKDSKGNIFYTDLQQVWKITSDGKKNIVVRNVHTHELYMDANDDLYGEHNWYNGERLNTWGSYAWCLRSNGKLDTVVGIKEGFLEDYSFVRDAEGNQYWAEGFKKIQKKTPDGKIITISEGRFRDVRWMHATANGKLYFIDQLSLYEIDKAGEVQLIAKDVSNPPGSSGSERHSTFGIWLDKEQNIYVAIFSQKAVKKISSDGTVSDFVYSEVPWAPVSGLFDDKGYLWLMECNTQNEIRVRKISTKELKQATSQIKTTSKNRILPISLVSGLIILMGFVTIKLLENKFTPSQPA